MFRHDEHAHNMHHGHTMSALNWVMFLRAVAVSITGLFVPVILFQLGHSFAEVMLFFLVYQLFVIPLQWVTLQSIRKFGVEHTIMLSAIPSSLSFFVLLFMEQHFGWIVLLAFLSAIADIFFWIPYHFDYLFATKKTETGKSSGFLLATQIIGSTFGPLVGAMILTWWTKNVLLIIAALLALAYALPLFSIKTTRKVRVDYGVKLNMNTFAFFCEGLARGSFSIVWPVYLIISGVTVMALGVLYTGARFGVAIASAIFGRMTDHHESKKLFRGFTIATTATYAARIVFLTPAITAIITVFGEIFFTFMNVPFTKRWLDIAKRDGPQFLIQREIMVCVGRITLLAIVGLIGMTNVLFACFVGLIVGAIGTLGFMCIAEPITNAVLPTQKVSTRMSTVKTKKKKSKNKI